MGTLISALVEAINSPTRAAPLRGLAYIKYPGRELQPRARPDGAIQIILKKRGFEYKAKSPRPKSPPKADTEGIWEAIAITLPPQYLVLAVTDRGEFIEIILEERT